MPTVRKTDQFLHQTDIIIIIIKELAAKKVFCV